MRNRLILLTIAAAMMIGGVASAQVRTRDHRTQPPPKRQPPPPPPADPTPPPPVREPATPPPAEFDRRGWQLLGEHTVQGKRDKDTIQVGAYEGKFDQIVLVIVDGDVEMKKMVVTFRNGEKFKPKLKHVFRDGQRSRVIDLPGNDRFIKKIDLAYKKFRRGRAVVQVWGRDTRDRRDDRDRDRDRDDRGRGDRWDARGWDKLGEVRVQGKRDRDTLKIGRDDGRFSKLTFVAEDSDLEVYDIVVTFGNGETFEPKVRHTFKEGTRTRAIDLPGKDRFIKRIDFRYGNLPGGGRATLVVYGLPETAPAPTPAPPPPPPPVWDDRGWTLLGEQTVSGKADLDRIVIGKDDGKFRQLTIVVLDSDLQMNDLVVFFGNGDTFNPKLKQFFKDGSRTRVIDLPRKRRFIDKIEMSYGNLPGGGRARVQVWGK